MNVIGISIHALLVFGVVHFASSLKREAKNTSKALSQATVNSQFSDSEKLDFIYFMSQLKSRNLKIRNILFELDWNILTAVRLLTT